MDAIELASQPEMVRRTPPPLPPRPFCPGLINGFDWNKIVDFEWEKTIAFIIVNEIILLEQAKTLADYTGSGFTMNEENYEALKFTLFMCEGNKKQLDDMYKRLSSAKIFYNSPMKRYESEQRIKQKACVVYHMITCGPRYYDDIWYRGVRGYVEHLYHQLRNIIYDYKSCYYGIYTGLYYVG